MHHPVTQSPAKPGAGAYYPQPLRPSSDLFKLLALAAATSAALTAVICHEVVYKRDIWQAEAYRAHQAYEAGCVKKYGGGRSYDPCEAEALRAAEAAQSQLMHCLAAFDKQPDDRKDFDAACQSPGPTWSHPYE